MNRAIQAITALGLLIMAAAYVVTFWAIGKSQERTACYHTAREVSDCSQPGAFERFVRSTLG